MGIYGLQISISLVHHRIRATNAFLEAKHACIFKSSNIVTITFWFKVSQKVFQWSAFLSKMIHPRVELSFKWSKYFASWVKMRYWTFLCLWYWKYRNIKQKKYFHNSFLTNVNFFIFQFFYNFGCKIQSIWDTKKCYTKK